MAGGIDTVGIVSIIVTAIYAIGSYLLASYLGRKLAKVEKWVLTWLIFDAVIHFSLDIPFVFISLTGNVNDSKNVFALPWKEFGKTDRRVLTADPILVSVGLVSCLVAVLSIVLVHAIMKGKFYRYFLQIFIASGHLFGVWMSFCPEWLAGFPNLDMSTHFCLKFMMVFCNCLWIGAPTALLYQAWKALEHTRIVHPRTPHTPTTATDPAGRYSLRSKDKEGPFLVLSFTGTVQNSTHFTALLWQEYGKADKRYLGFDANLVAMELLTVVVTGLLAVVLINAIVRDKFYRHYLQIVMCTCELYGGWMTFGPEWLTGSQNLVTDNPLFLWVYLIFFNGLWVVIPFALMWQSWKAMEKLRVVVKPKTRPSLGNDVPAEGSPPRGRYNLRRRGNRKEA